MTYTNSKEIFSHIEKSKASMSYNDASKLINDLAYVLVPFDRTHKEFQSLISRIRMLLKS